MARILKSRIQNLNFHLPHTTYHLLLLSTLYGLPSTVISHPPLLAPSIIRRSSFIVHGSLRRTRHLGDFRNWKDHDAFKKAFDRLLGDLKAEETAASDK
jgi:hypothetical protein